MGLTLIVLSFPFLWKSKLHCLFLIERIACEQLFVQLRCQRVVTVLYKLLCLIKTQKNLSTKAIRFFFLLLLYLLLTIDILPDFSFRYATYSNQAISETKSNFSDHILFLGYNQKKEKPECKESECKSYTHSYDLNFELLGYTNQKSSSIDLYAGKNAFFAIGSNTYGLNIGRVSSNFYNTIFKDWYDGTDGLVFYYKSKEVSIQFSMLDFYSGYKLSDKFYLLDPKQKENSTGNRFRSSVSIDYYIETWKLSLLVSYLNTGNWGKFSLDETSNKGDSDYLYHVGGLVKTSGEFYEVGLLALLAKGLDRTTYSFSTRTSSIPISGELLGAFFTVKYLYTKFRTSVYLPDGDKRSTNRDVLELGFVGMGTSPFDSNILLGSVNYLPSAWVTHKGLEKTDQLQNSRRNSLWVHSELTFNLSNFELSLSYQYILPRRFDTASTGNISFAKTDYEKGFLSEPGLGIQYNDYIENFFVKFQYSYLYSTFHEKTKNQFLSFQGGIKL